MRNIFKYFKSKFFHNQTPDTLRETYILGESCLIVDYMKDLCHESRVSLMLDDPLINPYIMKKALNNIFLQREIFEGLCDLERLEKYDQEHPLLGESGSDK